MDRRRDRKKKAVMTVCEELPDHFIQQLLESVSTIFAVRASILSKEWQRLASSVPVLDFNEDEYERATSLGHKAFVEFVKTCLKRREKDKSLHKFSLTMNDGDFITSCRGCFDLVDTWVSFAIDRNVKELYISKSDYCPSQTVLNAQCLTVLTLVGMPLFDSDELSLPALKSLTLKNLQMCFSSLFLQLDSGCPAIQNLFIIDCEHLVISTIVISNSSLKSLQVWRSGIPDLFRVEVMNLESLSIGYTKNDRGDNFDDDEFSGERLPRCNVDFSSCGALRNLELYWSDLKGAWLTDFGSRFPLLERLIFYEFYGGRVEHINIIGQHLKHLILFECRTIKNVIVDTPNLQSFWFSAGSPTMLASFCVNAPNLSEATLMISRGSELNPSLQSLLANFDSSKKVTLYATDPEDLIFPEETRKTCSPPLPSLKHLEVRIRDKEICSAQIAMTDPILRNSLRWMATSLEICSVNRKLFDI